MAAKRYSAITIPLKVRFAVGLRVKLGGQAYGYSLPRFRLMVIRYFG